MTRDSTASALATDERPSAPLRPSLEANDNDEGDCCPFASPPANRALLRAVNCELAPCRRICFAALVAAAPSIHAFMDGTIVYVTSQNWWDLISIYLIRLRDRPFCEFPSPPGPPPLADVYPPPPPTQLEHFECQGNASWYVAAAVAWAMLLALSLLLVATEQMERRYSWHSLGMLPSMVAMTVGWAYGTAATSALDELASALHEEDLYGRGRIFNVLFSCIATCITTLIILWLQPLARRRSSELTVLERKDWRGACSAWVYGLCDLALRGLKYMVMILWAYTFRKFLLWGLGDSERESGLYFRALFVWAVAMAFVGAWITVRLHQWRRWLLRHLAKVEAELQRRAPSTFDDLFADDLEGDTAWDRARCSAKDEETVASVGGLDWIAGSSSGSGSGSGGASGGASGASAMAASLSKSPGGSTQCDPLGQQSFTSVALGGDDATAGRGCAGGGLGGGACTTQTAPSRATATISLSDAHAWTSLEAASCSAVAPDSHRSAQGSDAGGELDAPKRDSNIGGGAPCAANGRHVRDDETPVTLPAPPGAARQVSLLEKSLSFLIKEPRGRPSQRLSRSSEASVEAVGRILGKLERQLLRFSALEQLLVLMEGTFAWVTGVAIMDAVYENTTLAMYPDWRIILADLAIALFFTVGSVVWLVVTGQKTVLDEELYGVRDEIEKFYITNALSFVVGFAWVIVMRDLSTIIADSIDAPTAPNLSFATQAVLVFVLGPLLTMILIFSKLKSFSKALCPADTLQLLMQKAELGSAADLSGAEHAELGRKVHRKREALRRLKGRALGSSSGQDADAFDDEVELVTIEHKPRSASEVNAD